MMNYSVRMKDITIELTQEPITPSIIDQIPPLLDGSVYREWQFRQRLLSRGISSHIGGRSA